MKKTLFVLLLALVLALSVIPVTVSAGEINKATIEFSTEGPETYADGTKVLDGESYAFVWTPDGETFGGFHADGTAVGNSKVALMAPIAGNGGCRRVLFQMGEEYMKSNYPGGTWGIYLLDTRKYEEGGKNAIGVGGAVLGYVKIVDNIIPFLSPLNATDGTIYGMSAGTMPPTIKNIKLINEMVYLYLPNTAPAVNYAVAAGQDPGSLFPVSQQPELGGGANETIIITPKNGTPGFSSLGGATTYSEGNVWIVVSIVSAFVVTVSFLMLLKKKKKPALVNGAQSKDEK